MIVVKTLPLLPENHFWRITNDALCIAPVVQLRKRILFFSVKIDSLMTTYYHYEENLYKGIFEPAGSIIRTARTLAAEHFPKKGLCEDIESFKVKTYALDRDGDNEELIDEIYEKAYGDYPGGAKLPVQKIEIIN